MCSYEHDQTRSRCGDLVFIGREQRRLDFYNTYQKEPTEQELDIFIKYVGLVKEARRHG